MTSLSSFRTSTLTMLCASLISVFAHSASAQEKEVERIKNAIEVLSEVMQVPEKGIPPQLLQNAEGVAIIPNLFKAGLIIGGQRGQGLVMVRRQDRSWSNPAFITLTGGSIGLQVGAQSNDIVLVFKNRRGVQNIATGKFTLGGDASVAAGPVGRQASAATDARLQAEVYSYARSRGLFAGLSLEGAALQINESANMRFYNDAKITADRIFADEQLPPEPATKLLSDLEFYAPAVTGDGAANNQQLRRVR